MAAEDPTSAALADPLGMIVRVIAELEPGLDTSVVAEVVAQVAAGRHKRRRLALALVADPTVLTDGRSASPLVVQQLIWALRKRGARRVALGCCAVCGRPARLPHTRGAERVCSNCWRGSHRASCAGCGNNRRVSFRDRDGQPRCRRCPPEEATDPTGSLLAIIAQVEPTLPTSVATAAIERALPFMRLRHRAVQILADSPELLGGTSSRIPPALLRLIEELQAAGATSIARPPCPHCGRVVRLPEVYQGMRICRRCVSRVRAVPCTQCGAVRAPSARDEAGRPLCSVCFQALPANLEPCIRCGRRRPVNRRTPEGPLCRGCFQGPTVTCTVCGRVTACPTGNRVGRPRCSTCARPRAPCARCGRVKPVDVQRPDGPVCSACWRRDPSSRRPCQACGTVGHLVEKGRCACCVLGRRLHVLLSGPDGTIPAELHGVYQTLAATDPPRAALRWLRNPTASWLLAEFANRTRPLTHAALDELPPTSAVAHLRSVLVASGCLPPRDEVLVRLERWIDQTVTGIADGEQRRLIRMFAVWYELRRLRQRVGTGQTGRGQAAGVRARVRAAVRFLAWLQAHDRTLATCQQADIDQWRADKLSHVYAAHDFIRWAVNRRLAGRELHVPPHSWTAPSSTIDNDERWMVARRLLADATLNPGDRVAGLLVLLYAQPVSQIATLTVDHVVHDDTGVSLRLGECPIQLPAPLDDLVRTLLATRKGHAAVASQPTSPWLFPGGRPGQPISADRLMVRLNHLGIYARKARSAALLQLSTQLPVGVLARLLGIHPHVAALWQQISGAQWTTYAADFSRRGIPADPAAPQPG